MTSIRSFIAPLLALVLMLAPATANANPQLLVDMQTGAVLYEQDAGLPWHPASLTKLMTAFVTFGAIADGRVTLDTPVIVSKHAWGMAPSKSGLKAGSALTMRDALYVMLVKSANDIAVAIAETVAGSEPAFVGEMNATAQKLGLTNTHFIDANGLHDDGNVTSARDLAILALYIRQLYPQYLPIFATEAVTLGKMRLKSNNKLLTHFAGTTGMKTGYICESGQNIVATAERNGRALMAIVLGSATVRERGEMTAQMLLRGFSGAATGTGKTVLQLANVAGEPTNMRPLVCGKGAKEYLAERASAYPMGLKGEPSYLTDKIEPHTYAATDLGQLRDVPLPRPRPFGAPVGTSFTAAALTAPVPATRP